MLPSSLSNLTLSGCKSADSDQLSLSNSLNRPAILLVRLSSFDSLPRIFAPNGQVRQAARHRYRVIMPPAKTALNG